MPPSPSILHEFGNFVIHFRLKSPKKRLFVISSGWVHRLLSQGRATLHREIVNDPTMKLTTYNRPFPNSFFRFFDDYNTQAQAFRPAVNIVETDETFELEVLAPGRVKDHFAVNLNEGVLEITYTSEKTGDETTPNFRRKEFQLTDFTRRFQLDDTVINDEDINATYTDGVLRLTLPKREEALPKAPRQIAVG